MGEQATSENSRTHQQKKGLFSQGKKTTTENRKVDAAA